MERRLISPQHEQALKCPRCESTRTKFCYYNNYSLSQPRYFCKTCRRYRTKGGTLRNIPVGGGCRKNKKVSSNPKKPSSNTDLQSSSVPISDLHVNGQQNYSGLNYNVSQMNSSTDLQLAFPHEQIHSSSLIPNGLFGSNLNVANPGFWIENPAQIDYMENKYETLLGRDDLLGGANGNFHGVCSPFEAIPHVDQSRIHDPGNGTILDSYQHEVDMKPNTLSKNVVQLEWHDNNNHQQQQQAAACNSDAWIGYLGGIASWTGLMNAYGSSNPLV